jgi:hypothetical protein
MDTPRLPFQHRLRRLFFDMHLPDWTVPGQSGGMINELRDVATRFDPEHLIELFVRARVNSLVFYAKCQYGNFYCDTNLGHKHSGLGELDLLGRVVELAHRRDITVIAYYSNAWDVNVARAHPDWMMQDAEGGTSYKRWPRVCLNSPYRDLVQSHLRDLFTRYNLDGVWMDMLHVLPCYCPRCQALYFERYRKPMPVEKKGQAWVDLVHFQYDYMYDYIAQAKSIVKGVKPDAIFMFNYFGSPYASPSLGLDATRQLTLSDCGSAEGYTEWHGLQFPSYMARLMRSVMRNRPYEILTSRFVRTWDFTLRSTEQMRYEAFSAVSNGAAVVLDDSPYHDGTPEPSVYTELEKIYSEIEAREPYLLDSQPVFYAGLYHSLKTREMAEMVSLAEHDGSGTHLYSFHLERLQAEADTVLSTQGAFKAMVEGHMPTEFLYDQGLTADELRHFKVILLPNVAAMDEAEALLLRDYVASGGGLVATGATSLYDPGGEQRANFLLADLFGVDFVQRSPYPFTFIRLKPGPLVEDADIPLAHYRPLIEVRPNQPIRVAATLLEPLIATADEVYYHNNQPSPYRDTDMPAIVMTQYGQGRVVYISGEPEANYCVLGHKPYRQLLLNALRWAAREVPGIVPHAPLNTEVVFRRKEQQQIVHFLTCWPLKRPVFKLRSAADSIEESFPVYGIRVDIPDTTQSATFIGGGTQGRTAQPLGIHRDSDHTWVVLPHIQLWETLVLE